MCASASHTVRSADGGRPAGARTRFANYLNLLPQPRRPRNRDFPHPVATSDSGLYLRSLGNRRLSSGRPLFRHDLTLRSTPRSRQYTRFYIYSLYECPCVYISDSPLDPSFPSICALAHVQFIWMQVHLVLASIVEDSTSCTSAPWNICTSDSHFTPGLYFIVGRSLSFRWIEIHCRVVDT